MSIHHSLLTSSALQILKIRSRIHKEVLCQHSRTPGLTKNIELFLPVQISIRHICPDTTTRKVFDSRLTQTFCQFIRLRLPRTREHTPSGRIKPFRAVSSGVHMNAYQDNILLAQEETGSIYTPYTFCQRNISIFWDQQLCIETFIFRS